MLDQTFFKEILTESRKLASEVVGKEKEALTETIDNFIDGSKQELNRWLRMYQAGELSKEEIADLVRARESYVQVKALEKAGMSLIRIESFRNRLLNIIIDKTCMLVAL